MSLVQTDKEFIYHGPKKMSDRAGTLPRKCRFAGGVFNEGTTELLPDRRGGMEESKKVSKLEQRG